MKKTGGRKSRDAHPLSTSTSRRRGGCNYEGKYSLVFTFNTAFKYEYIHHGGGDASNMTYEGKDSMTIILTFLVTFKYIRAAGDSSNMSYEGNYSMAIILTQLVKYEYITAVGMLQL